MKHRKINSKQNKMKPQKKEPNAIDKSNMPDLRRSSK